MIKNGRFEGELYKKPTIMNCTYEANQHFSKSVSNNSAMMMNRSAIAADKNDLSFSTRQRINASVSRSNKYR
jgi:hypothetical protein